MAERIVHAIVLRRRDSGESDRRLTVLTEECGKIDVLAKGARKGGSRLAGISDPLSAAVMNLATGKQNFFITQAQPLHSFRGLRTDFDRLSCGLALVELFAAVLPVDEPFPEAYALLAQSLHHLEAHGKPIVALVWAEVRLLELSGFLPQFGRCVVTDREIVEGEPFLSPRAGGYVSDQAAITYTDRFRTRAEVLYGLIRLPDFDEPPTNMKYAAEALADLLPFWHNITDSQLPANETAVREFRHSNGAG
jgi:DNA repair protein RecO (recombination protein O)